MLLFINMEDSIAAAKEDLKRALEPPSSGVGTTPVQGLGDEAHKRDTNPGSAFYVRFGEFFVQVNAPNEGLSRRFAQDALEGLSMSKR